jgi:hypothetical protein
MEFGTMSVLVDGTFKSPLVLCAVLLASAAMATPAAVAAYWWARLSGSGRLGLLLVVVLAALSSWLSPGLLELVATGLANIGAKEPFALCLIPTNLAARDYAPAILSVVASGASWWRGSRRALRGRAATRDAAVT